MHLATCQDFGDLDKLMERFRVARCVIDGLPETHATREFAKRHNYDIDAIVRALQKASADGGRQVVSLPSKRIREEDERRKAS